MARGKTVEMEMVTHSSILAWKIPWTEKLGRLQSMRSEKSQTQQLNNNKKRQGRAKMI